MFEVKISTPLHAHHGVHVPFADEDLTAFSWTDLVSRLCAARELRTALAHVPGAARASFDAMAAEIITNRSESASCSGKPLVNLAPSGNCKVDGAKDAACADSAPSPDRGNA
jgi:hypothetical protein